MQHSNGFHVKVFTGSDEPRFAVNEWPNFESPTSVRSALEIYRDNLIEQVKNLEVILVSEMPERAEWMMVDSTMIRSAEVVLQAPPDASTFKLKLHEAVESMLIKLSPCGTDCTVEQVKEENTKEV